MCSMRKQNFKFSVKSESSRNLQTDKNLERHSFLQDNLALLELLCFFSFQQMCAHGQLPEPLRTIMESLFSVSFGSKRAYQKLKTKSISNS
ncbi:hypothetical protein D7V86_18170 [bacterium D16-51]|nr:hypothetical protein D7V96_19855 [bacterium D16-59]RKI57350.1 hypothetical protein D7V86_18170 [bacterium D16-51]